MRKPASIPGLVQPQQPKPVRQQAVIHSDHRIVATQVRPHGRDFAGLKPVRIDLHLYTTTQAPDRSDSLLNVDGFSDAVFSVVASFLTEDARRFLADVEAIKL